MTRLVELEINDIAFGGKGVGRLDGKAVFVPYVIDGEKVQARLIREHKNYIDAELEILQMPSPHRVQPPCPYFGDCGGCVYQHIDYQHQLAIKSRQVQQTLARIGGLTDAPVQPIIPSPLAYEYRNRVTVHARNGVVGFFQRESNQLLDVEVCPIASPQVNARLTELRAIRPREGHYTLRAHRGARVFTQANHAVAAAMLDLVSELLKQSRGTLIDAYCGAGFFAKRLRARFDRVLGIDWDKHAITAAREDAYPNEQYIAGDVGEKLMEWLAGAYSLIVDPPSAGLSSRALDAIVQAAPARLIYVSCNPATLARDLAVLNNSFRIDSITPLDMFPQTAEIEVVAELTSSAAHAQA